jgi:hypothetical protein
LAAGITTLATIRLPKHDLAAIVANITKQVQNVRQQEAGCCIVVVCWDLHKYLQCQIFGGQKKKKRMILNDKIFGNSGMYLWTLRGLLTLPISFGRQRHKFKAKNMEKFLVIYSAKGKTIFAMTCFPLNI